MKAQRISGIVAAVSGAALLIAATVAVVSAAVSEVASPSTATFGFSWPTSMMGSGGMGPGMMGAYGMGPGMMGAGHMGVGETPGTQSAAIAGAQEVRVSASEFALSPSEIVLPAGTAVNLTLENKGALSHDLTIPGLGARVVAAAGQTYTVGLRNLTAGTYDAYCSVSGHAAAGMRATVVVR